MKQVLEFVRDVASEAAGGLVVAAVIGLYTYLGNKFKHKNNRQDH